MENLKAYIHEVLGADIQVEPLKKESMDKMPYYIRESFQLDYIGIYKKQLILVEIKNNQSFTNSQVEKQLQYLKDVFHKDIILVSEDLSSIERKRFIQKGVNFIVPGKQLFLPNLLIDLTEQPSKRKNKKEKLLPSAQYILLYKILHRNENINEYSFKQLAKKLGYTQMAITKAVDNLKYNELCTVDGTKEKYIQFKKSVMELWQDSMSMLVNPVIKKVYVDELPANIQLYSCNASALPEYTDMSPSRQQYKAIEKALFYSLQKGNQWINMNDKEGQYCLEIWKYNPARLAEGITEEGNVDPLSLYLSMKEITDARIEMASEQIIKKYIW